MRATLESDWSWRVAAYATRRGYLEGDIQTMLRGPLAMPDVSALLSVARNAAPDERSMASGPGVPSAATTGERDRERPVGERPSAENEAATVGEAAVATVAAVDAAGEAGTTGHQEAAAPAADVPTREILSENVEHLSRGEGEADDQEGATGGTAQAATGGALDGGPGR